jgi:CDP-diacylglycerol--glycerol-3-phosphate 3-phosphatidyltransferase
VPALLTVFLGVIATALGSMVVYALRGGKKDPDAERKSAQFLGGAGDFVLHWFLWAVTPATTLSLRLGLTPDFYNFVGLGLGLLSGVFIARGALELGGWAIALGGVCDILDGRIARLTGVASLYGDFIDSMLDRFVEAFVFLGFAVFLRPFAYGSFWAAAALASSLLVSYARARGESLDVDCSGGLMQRAERLVLTCLVCLTDPALSARLGVPKGTCSLWVLALIALSSTVTAVHRTVWISRRLLAGAKGKT